VNRGSLHDESGQVTVLVVGMAMVVLAVSGLAIDGTRAFLERRALQNVADGAALAAADQLDRQGFYEDGGDQVTLDAEGARLVAREWLERSGRGVRAEVVVDDPNVRVLLRSEIRTQFLRLVGIDAIPVAVASHARPEVGSVP
jgi:hypothetical protein